MSRDKRFPKLTLVAMTFPRKTMLWAGLALLVIIALFGVILFKDIVPDNAPVRFWFAGWTNDAQGGRSAVLAISNQSWTSVTYFADRNRQPRCNVTVIASHQKQGNHAHIIYSNFTINAWDGFLPLQLPAQARVDCVLPWRDEYAKAQISVSYIPAPSFADRIFEKLLATFSGRPGTGHEIVPLAAAPWTNTAVRPF